MYLTASKLYDYFQCPHKVWRDQNGPQDEKIQETNPFVELLWNKGVLHEQKIISTIGSYVDLSQGTLDERFVRTQDELNKGTQLIYQGVIRYGSLLGIPDLIKKNDESFYIPIDIKSGKGMEGADDFDEDEGKPKKHYAVQLCHYIEILTKLGYKTFGKGIIIDITGKEVEYDLASMVSSKSSESFMSLYRQVIKEVEDLLQNKVTNKPALAGSCKLCPWYYSCKKWVNDNEDLTKVFYLGRNKRDVINKDIGITRVSELVNVNIQNLLQRKKKEKAFLKGIGEGTLNDIIRRADIIVNKKKPEFRAIQLPNKPIELFFDIEDDPTQDFIYLHGIYQKSSEGEKYIPFIAMDHSEEGEKATWVKFWEYINSLPVNEFAVYYYSPHEKSAYRALQRKYPDVINENDLAAFFDSPNWIDLYHVVLKNTDWPLSSYSLKDIATYLGFKWRDETPSGALSIQWYNQFLESKDQSVMNRILEYNEDDCKATMVLKEKLISQ
jgi:uncharacterized protein